MGPAGRVDVRRRSSADTVVFCSIAASAIGITSFGDFATYTALGWLYKTAVEIVAAAGDLPRDRVHQAPRAHISARRLRLR